MLEAPSEKSKQRAARDISEKIDQDHKSLTALKRHVFGEEETVKKGKRKGPKGPNPLSCKKRKAKVSDVTGGKVAKRKRKRHKRIHMLDHVKDYVQ